MEEEEESLALLGGDAGGQPLFVLPLYSLLSQDSQNRSVLPLGVLSFYL